MKNAVKLWRRTKQEKNWAEPQRCKKKTREKKRENKWKETEHKITKSRKTFAERLLSFERPQVNEEISLDNATRHRVGHTSRTDNKVAQRRGREREREMEWGRGQSHILMFAVVSLKHFVNGLFCLAISLKGLPRTRQTDIQTHAHTRTHVAHLKTMRGTFRQWAALFSLFVKEA